MDSGRWCACDTDLTNVLNHEVNEEHEEKIKKKIKNELSRQISPSLLSPPESACLFFMTFMLLV